MRYWVSIATFFITTSIFAEERQPLVAHIIDSSTDRIPLLTVAPEYPRKARRDRIEGEVQVCFDVTREGTTRRIAVRSSTYRAFEKPSMKAVRASSFRPIGSDEQLQAIKSCRTFVFALEPAEKDMDSEMTTKKLEDFARRYTNAWNSRTPANVAAFFAVDGMLSVNGSPSIGREAIAAVADSFMTGFPDMVLKMETLDIEPGKVTFRWNFVGTNTGPEGTGNAVDFSGYEEWSIGDNGLITQSMGNFDNDEYQRQLKHGI